MSNPAVHMDDSNDSYLDLVAICISKARDAVLSRITPAEAAAAEVFEHLEKMRIRAVDVTRETSLAELGIDSLEAITDVVPAIEKALMIEFEDQDLWGLNTVSDLIEATKAVHMRSLRKQLAMMRGDRDATATTKEVAAAK